MVVFNAFMQHLGVNYGGIWRFELGFFICFFLFFVLLKKSGPIFTALHEKQTLSSDENSDRL